MNAPRYVKSINCEVDRLLCGGNLLQSQVKQVVMSRGSEALTCDSQSGIFK